MPPASASRAGATPEASRDTSSGTFGKKNMNHALSSAEFVAKFAELSRRLAEMDVCTHTADLHWGHFGHWTLILTKRQEAVRFDYDRRDSFIRVEASPIREWSSPNEWTELTVKGIDYKKDDVLAYIENFIRARFTI
jgi:hypothetical protein